MSVDVLTSKGRSQRGMKCRSWQKTAALCCSDRLRAGSTSAKQALCTCGPALRSDWSKRRRWEAERQDRGYPADNSSLTCLGGNCNRRLTMHKSVPVLPLIPGQLPGLPPSVAFCS